MIQPALLPLLALEARRLAEAAASPPDGEDALALLADALARATRRLNRLARAAVARLLSRPAVLAPSAIHLFSPAELAELAELGAAVLATADLAGRAQVQDLAARAASRGLREALEAAPSEPLPPERALDYFRRLAPTLGVDPQRWGDDLRRRAFTLAAATDAGLLASVQGAIIDLLRSGAATHGPGTVRAVLDSAGVSSRNPQYADMVWRTNAMDAYNQGVQDEVSAMQDTFPVWQYSNPTDSRSRPEHAERDGKYYPSSVPFTKVRGTEAKDVVNCRCTSIPISKYEWRRLKARGAKIADGYPDVPAEEPAPRPRPGGPAPSLQPAPGPASPGDSTPAPASQPRPAATAAAPPDPAALVAAVVASHPDRFASLLYVRQQLAAAGVTSRAAQDEAIRAARARGLVSGSRHEGRHGISDDERRALLDDGDEQIGYLSPRL